MVSAALLLLSSVGLAQVSPPPACGTPERYRGWKGPFRSGSSELPPPGPDKLVVDPYELPNTLESDNFAMHWGDEGTVSESFLESVLEEAEVGWGVYIDELGFGQPVDGSSHKVNLYVGDSGDGAPEIGDTAAGYHINDDEDRSVIVLAPSTLKSTRRAGMTVVHELFHALQHGSGNHGSVFDTLWFWEATASWSESLVYPDEADTAETLYSYALLPHRTLPTFSRSSASPLIAARGYGAFIWAQHLSEFHGGPETIRLIWEEPADAGDPIVAAEALLTADGLDPAEVFADFALRNATWDYAEGARYRRAVSVYASYFEDYGSEVVETFGSAGTQGPFEPDGDLLPQHTGYSVVAFDSPPAGPLEVVLSGDLEGSRGSPARWLMSVAIGDGSASWEVVSDSTEDGVLSLSLDVPAGTDEGRVVVVPWSPGASDLEDFGYSLEILTSWVDEDDDDGAGGGGEDTGLDEGGGCGCGRQGMPGDWQSGAVFLLLGIGWARRRHGDPLVPPPRPRSAAPREL